VSFFFSLSATIARIRVRGSMKPASTSAAFRIWGSWWVADDINSAMHQKVSLLRYCRLQTADRVYYGESWLIGLWYCRYKGMAASSNSKTPSRGSAVSPQSTGAGFSQMGGRPGAANESSGAAMSVLLSWHEKVVEVAGLGCVSRSMTDWRKV
jgi:hypothetical protein